MAATQPQGPQEPLGWPIGPLVGHGGSFFSSFYGKSADPIAPATGTIGVWRKERTMIWILRIRGESEGRRRSAARRPQLPRSVACQAAWVIFWGASAGEMCV